MFSTCYEKRPEFRVYRNSGQPPKQEFVNYFTYLGYQVSHAVDGTIRLSDFVLPVHSLLVLSPDSKIEVFSDYSDFSAKYEL
jgi:hypothetical protein